MELEGEYLDEKRNGKWKKYDENGILKFECEYVEGKGNGKEYFDNGNIKYEGEFADYLWNGKGKEYFHNGNVLFSGEYFEGRKWTGNGYRFGYTQFELKYGKGEVKEYNYDEELIFEGEYENGKRKSGIKYPERKDVYYDNDGYEYEYKYENNWDNNSVHSLDAADYIDSD